MHAVGAAVDVTVVVFAVIVVVVVDVTVTVVVVVIVVVDITVVVVVVIAIFAVVVNVVIRVVSVVNVVIADIVTIVVVVVSNVVDSVFIVVDGVFVVADSCIGVVVVFDIIVVVAVVAIVISRIIVKVVVGVAGVIVSLIYNFIINISIITNIIIFIFVHISNRRILLKDACRTFESLNSGNRSSKSVWVVGRCGCDGKLGKCLFQLRGREEDLFGKNHFDFIFFVGDVEGDVGRGGRRVVLDVREVRLEEVRDEDLVKKGLLELRVVAHKALRDAVGNENGDGSVEMLGSLSGLLALVFDPLVTLRLQCFRGASLVYGDPLAADLPQLELHRHGVLLALGRRPLRGCPIALVSLLLGVQWSPDRR